MTNKNFRLALLFLGLLINIQIFASTIVTSVADRKGIKDKLILDFINLRFGMFIHFNMGTYHQEQWAYPFHDPKSFKPTDIDCKQWAKAAKSAGMQYAVFTTKHHDGFSLWDTKVTNYDIATSDYKADIVKQYVDAFREAGIVVGLYFSVWDRHHGVEHGNINDENIAFTKQQLTELLTNYGEVRCLVIDGWGSKWGNGPDFVELPFAILADHVHSIQPNCLVINHSCKTDLSVTQLVHYEATHGQHCPYDNTIPSQQGPTLQSTWFWEPGYEKQELKSVESVVKELNFANTHYSNYLLNAAPNNRGLMDDNVVRRLAEIGKAVKLPAPLAKLPEIQKVHRNVKATSSGFSGEGFNPENSIDCDLFTRWKPIPNSSEPWVQLDFGKPEVFNKVVCGEFKSGIDAFRIEAMIDGDWKEIARGNEMTHNFEAQFADTKAQYFRIVLEKYRPSALLAEITFVKY